jgi:hypothetical protein
MSAPKQRLSLPVVAAEDYRHAVAGEPWELCPVAITGPVEYRSLPRDDSSEAIERLAEISLQTPLDFPTIGDAVLAGDHVALAVDPNVPRVADVVAGVLRVLTACEAGRISIVVWPEANDACFHTLRQRFQNAVDEPEHVSDLAEQSPTVTVTRHAPRDRRTMRYVAADANAEAIYLARDLVDADFTIPLIAARASDAAQRLDKAGVFPMFADASTMQRFQTTNTDKESEALAQEVSWLLGVQLVMMVSSSAAGSVARILTGTPDAIRGELDTLHASELADSGEQETLPTGEIIVAALDGDAHVQTWANVARAAIAASRHVEADGAIVVWSQLSERPGPAWQRELTMGDQRDFVDDVEAENDTETDSNTANDFAQWSTDHGWARKLANLVGTYRVFLHSQLADADLESVGIGVISSVDELQRLGNGRRGAGVLRAAQFHDASVSRIQKSSE